MRNNNQEPFPHILTHPDKNNGVIRFVTPDTIAKNDTITERNLQGNPSGWTFKIDQIQLIRKAKGDWTNWPSHPDYYEAKAHAV